MHHRKHFVRQMAQARAQEFLDHCRRVHQVAATHLGRQQALRGQQNLVGLSRTVLPGYIADEQAARTSGHRQERIEGREQIVLHDQLR